VKVKRYSRYTTMPVDPERKFPCETCGFKFKSAAHLKQHQKRKHEAMRDWMCEHCGHAFTRKDNLTQHIKFVHEKIRPFQCSQCSSRFTQQAQLGRHFRAVHEKRRDEVCEQCGQRFSTKGNLGEHVRAVHMRQRDHHCKECGRQFMKSADLLRHHKAVHQGTSGGFQCEHCSQQFARKGNLTMHIRVDHPEHGDAQGFMNELTSQEGKGCGAGLQHKRKYPFPDTPAGLYALYSALHMQVPNVMPIKPVAKRRYLGVQRPEVPQVVLMPTPGQQHMPAVNSTMASAFRAM